MIYGYVRVSTQDQNLDRQLDQLAAAYPDIGEIFADKISGSLKNRPELDRLLETVEQGDKVVICSLDRLARSLTDLIAIGEQLEKKGVVLESLKERIDFSTATGRLQFNLFGAFAEFEREIINERVRAGIEAARLRGQEFGRPRALDENGKKAVFSLFEKGELTDKEIAETFGISVRTVYRLKAEYKKKHEFSV